MWWRSAILCVLAVVLTVLPHVILRRRRVVLEEEAPVLEPPPAPVPVKRPSMSLKEQAAADSEALANLYEYLIEKDNITPKKKRKKAEPRKEETGPPYDKKSVLMFTMDSTVEYEKNAKKGGAAGEITIRRSLMKTLEEFGARVDVAMSDADFEKKCSVEKCEYDALVLDGWTWAAPGWVAKKQLEGREGKIFLLDFFGADGPRNDGIQVPPERILTAFPTYPVNTFLGYAYEGQHDPMPKKNQVVVWGKDPKHFQGKAGIIKAVAQIVQVHTTLSAARAPPSLRGIPNVVYRGHLTRSEWHKLLAESKAVLGLGDPLLGPTALDAVAHGCAYVDPVYQTPVKSYMSQHPYLRDHLPETPYVCNAKLNDPPSYVNCVRKALSHTPDLTPYVPTDFRPDVYRARVRTIFDPVLQRPPKS